LSAEVEARFEQWKLARGNAPADEGELESVAASGNLVVMPAPIKPTPLRRLPADFQAGDAPFPGAAENLRGQSSRLLGGERVGNTDPGQPEDLYARHEGGLVSRALGTAVHALLEELARLRLSLDWDAALGTIEHFAARVAAPIRACGIAPAQAAQIAGQALEMALAAARDRNGQWILSPHSEAESEASWAGVVEGTLRTVRVDRVFRAGLEPGSEGGQAWWIIDYKTAHSDSLSPDAVRALRPIFAPQLRAYGEILRNLHGAEATLRAGLYYPRMLVLDWWEL
jgi:hypothetical protein